MRLGWVACVIAAGCSDPAPPASTADVPVVPVDTGWATDVAMVSDVANGTDVVTTADVLGAPDVFDAGSPPDVVDVVDAPDVVSAPDVVAAPDASAMSDVVQGADVVDAGMRLRGALRPGRFSTLGVRGWGSGDVRIVDDEIESGDRLCNGSVCVTGGFLQ